MSNNEASSSPFEFIPSMEEARAYVLSEINEKKKNNFISSLIFNLPPQYLIFHLGLSWKGFAKNSHKPL